MYSDGWLPFQHNIKPLLKNPAIQHFFNKSDIPLNPWVAGSWDNDSKTYRAGNQTVKNVLGIHSDIESFRHGYIEKKYEIGSVAVVLSTRPISIWP